MPATAALLGATLAWGVTPVMLKYLAHADRVPDGFTANAVRYPLAALIYLPWFVLGLRTRQMRGLWLMALIPSGANLVMQTLWAWAPYYLDAGLLAFLLRLCVVWTIIGALLLFKDERRLARSPAFWMGAVLALVGFVVMSWGALRAGGGASLAGIAIIFGCGIFWGVYSIAVRAVMGRLHPLVVFSVVSSYTSVGLLAAAPLGEPASVLRLAPGPMAILGLSSLVGIALAHGLYYIAVQRIGVAICSLMLIAAPFISILSSWLVLGETFGGRQWVGGVILLAGAAVAVNTQKHMQPPRPPDAGDLVVD